METRQSTIKSW